MPAKRQYSRVVLEFNLGRRITAERWREIQAQMKQSGMPLTANNMAFVAKIKRMAPRYRLSSEALNGCVTLASVLGEKAIGLDIKREIYKLHPKLSRSKFYYWFNKCGFPFNETKEYEISYLAEVFYKLIGGR